MAVLADLLVAPFFRTTLTASIAIGADRCYVSDVSGLPVPTGNKFFYLTVVSSGNQAETVRINSVNPSTGELILLAGENFTSGWAVGDRAELWFTAEAFEDIQAAIEALGGGQVFTPDEVTVENVGGVLQVKAATGEVNGIDQSHIQDNAIYHNHMTDNSVGTAEIRSGAVTTVKVGDLQITDAKLASGIDAAKIASLLGSKLPVDTIPQITFAQIDYDVGTPRGGQDGDIFIEWEDYV